MSQPARARTSPLFPGLARRIAQVQRDLAALRDRLGGRPPPPFTLRRGGAAAAPAPALATRRVRVADVTRETDDAISLHLEDPSGAPFVFLPGQFFTVQLTIDGQRVRRAYSASSSALDGARLTLTIKRVAGGLCSNHLNEQIGAGDLVELLGPSGEFCLTPDAAARRRLVLLAGGSGITPMMSLARTLLACEPETRMALVFANRSERDIIFHEALAALSARHPERFSVRHVLEAPSRPFGGAVGRLDRAVATAELDALPLAADPEAEFFVCGPAPMMAEVRAALEARGVAATRIREERFTQPHLRPRAESRASGPATVQLTGAVTRALTLDGADTILEAALAAGAALPFSCAMGGCGACKVKRVAGEVEMEEPNCLTAEERAAGWVLTCVGRAAGDCTLEVVK